ncbi:uncharacterized protein LOC126599180 [Malus sylvestris]|uniref:uncharacterized protein LOC126599180 n=1 Tax=Malus sylvestris TaxID=3752 RepID=UPI0021ACF884|nr:uncharacterized protein LOC126599180 [Malus sylvestris]
MVGGLWRLWKCRNSLVFEKVAVDPLTAIHLLKQQWEEWVISDEAQVQPLSRGQLVRAPAPHQWIKPPFGTLKVNCDGAWCSRTGIGGVGWVARDFVGIFNGAGGIGNMQCVSSIMAEAEALRVALVACVAKGFTFIQLETDSQVLVDMIHGRIQPEVILDGILWDISILKQQFVAIEFLYTPRACNKAAHMVASYAVRMRGSHSWDGLELEWLFNTLASDVNILIRI